MRFATLLWTTSSSDCDAWPTYSGGANTAIATLRDTENLGSTWFTSSRPRFVVITPAGEVEEIVTKFRSETTPGLLDEVSSLARTLASASVCWQTCTRACVLTHARTRRCRQSRPHWLVLAAPVPLRRHRMMRPHLHRTRPRAPKAMMAVMTRMEPAAAPGACSFACARPRSARSLQPPPLRCSS